MMIDVFDKVFRNELTLEALSRLTEEHLLSTYNHSIRVGFAAIRVGKNLGLDDSQLYQLGLSVTHDIGKSKVPEHIIKKTQVLTKNEQNIMAAHTQYGADILQEIGFDKIAVLFALSHHSFRKTNPQPLPFMTAEETYLANIVAVVDTMDALLSRRAYRPPLAVPVVNGIVKSEYGTSDIVLSALELSDSWVWNP